MPEMLAVVSRPMFERWSDGKQVGDVLAWQDYESRAPRLGLLNRKSRLFLVTVRPPKERLWLVAIYENLRKRADGWWARELNTTPITDITHLRSKLSFDNGKGLSPKPGRLGNSLQVPRVLTADDVRLLEEAIRSDRGRGANVSEAIEGRQVDRSVTTVPVEHKLGRRSLLPVPGASAEPTARNDDEAPAHGLTGPVPLGMRSPRTDAPIEVLQIVEDFDDERFVAQMLISDFRARSAKRPEGDEWYAWIGNVGYHPKGLTFWVGISANVPPSVLDGIADVVRIMGFSSARASVPRHDLSPLLYLGDDGLELLRMI